MKDYTDLFDNLYALDLGKLPFNEEDWWDVHGELNLRYQSADHNNIFILIGTIYSLEEFVKRYKKRHHSRYGKQIGEIVLLKSLIK